MTYLTYGVTHPSPQHLKVSRSQSQNVIEWKFGGNLMYFISYSTDILTMTDFFALPSKLLTQPKV